MLLVGAFPVSAARTFYATAANFQSVVSGAKGGDTIRLSGTFGYTSLKSRNFGAVKLYIDARNATFTDTLKLDKIQGIKFIGGKYGSRTGTSYSGAVVAYGGADITFDKPTVIGANKGTGLFFTDAKNVIVSNGTFSQLGSGVVLRAVTNGTVTRNKSIGSASDGFQIVDSHFVKVTYNSCSSGTPRPGAHPDCVQLWSIKGKPVQSDIEISDNSAVGPTQGFTSFDPEAGGGLRISILRNRVDTSYVQGIACYNCVDSIISGNILTTQAGAKSQTRISVVGGSNNTVSNNSIGPKPAARTSTFARTSSFLDFDATASEFDLTANDFSVSTFAEFYPDDDAPFAVRAGSDGFESAGAAISAAVPEPGVWLMMIAGFGLVGASLRRQSSRTALAA